MLCFDIGANIGSRSRALLDIGARVVAVDPHPDCARTLREIPNLTVVEAAAGDRVGEADLLLTSASTISSMAPDWIKSVRASGRFAEFTWDQRIRVPVVTLDELIACHGRPDFVKVDVEGYEREVIAGLSRPVPLLCFEFAPECYNGAAECVSMLKTLGMDLFNFSVGESQKLALDRWVEADELTAKLGNLPPASFADVYSSHQESSIIRQRSCPQTSPGKSRH